MRGCANCCLMTKMEELKKSKKKGIHHLLETHYIKNMRKFKNYKAIVREGEPFVEIVKMAKKESMKLMVMGTHGRTGLDHILCGSTAEKVVRKSPSPVLTARLPGKKFTML